MEKSFKIVGVLVLILINMIFLIGCTDHATRFVRQSFDEEMRNHSTLGDTWRRENARVQNVTLIRTGLTTFDGMVTVSIRGNRHQVPITVTADRRSVMWQTTGILPFAFLLEYMLSPQ
jgi:hypothetical protein